MASHSSRAGSFPFCLLGRLLPLPSNPTLSPAVEPGGGHCVPMRHFVTRRRINVSVAAARLLARPDVPARPLPSPTALSAWPRALVTLGCWALRLCD